MGCVPPCEHELGEQSCVSTLDAVPPRVTRTAAAGMPDITASRARRRALPGALLPGLDRRFEAIVFDWDGTAVADRAADATRLRTLVEELSAEVCIWRS